MLDGKVIIRLGLTILLSLSCTLGWSHEAELLKIQDVHQVMDQILKLQVDSKGVMTSTLIRKGFKTYIEQFDPDRIYLLDSEVSPYLQLNDSQTNAIIDSYKNNDLSSFIKLNDTMQKAVERSRQLRQEIAQAHSNLYIATSMPHEYKALDGFAKTNDELKARISKEYAYFLHEENKIYGEAQVRSRGDAQTLVLFEKQLRRHEDQYLGANDGGQPLTALEKENLFSLHVLKALSSSLDAHTNVLNSTEAKDMQIRLEKKFEGIGIQLKKKGKGIVITSVLEGSPAFKSGNVKVNDLLVKVNDKDVEDQSLESVLALLQGPKDSVVKLVLKRPYVDNMLPIELKRDTIQVNEGRVESSYENFGNGIIGKVAVHSFYQGVNGVSTADDLRDAVKQLQKKNMRGLIIDMRDNTGGFLIQAVDVVGEFITRGIVVIAKYSNGDEHIYRDTNGTDLYNGPLIILTSKETASAAEIVSQALQDYGVAIIVGDVHTYGKGTIQSQTVTGGGSSSFFKVTVGKYYTVSGKTPQLQGVKADIVVPSQISQERIGEEYLEHTLSADTIPALYTDPLNDVDSNMKPWFLKYYSPVVQNKEEVWKMMVPTLKKNSEYRIQNNKDYQTLLARLKASTGGDYDAPNFTDSDLQMEEAVNIVKDMILLHSQSRSGVNPSPDQVLTNR